MKTTNDPILGALGWGLAICASVLLHVSPNLVEPPKRIREEVRIEVVSRPNPPLEKPPRTPTSHTPSSEAKEEDSPTEGALSTTAPPNPPVVVEDQRSGLFRVGARRPSLEERNRAYDRRQTALIPLRETLAALEQRLRVAKIDPDAAYRCGGGDAVRPIDVKERAVGHWAPFVPHKLLPERYAEGLSQIQVREGRRVTTKSHVELTLPARELVLELEQPEGALVSIGLAHVRCAVALDHSSNGFPLTWRGIPMRIATKEGVVVAAVVDATLHEDATFFLRATDGAKLPFRTGRVRHGNLVASRLSALATLARLFQ